MSGNVAAELRAIVDRLSGDHADGVTRTELCDVMCKAIAEIEHLRELAGCVSKGATFAEISAKSGRYSPKNI